MKIPPEFAPLSPSTQASWSIRSRYLRLQKHWGRHHCFKQTTAPEPSNQTISLLPQSPHIRSSLSSSTSGCFCEPQHTSSEPRAIFSPPDRPPQLRPPASCLSHRTFFSLSFRRYAFLFPSSPSPNSQLAPLHPATPTTPSDDGSPPKRAKLE